MGEEAVPHAIALRSKGESESSKKPMFFAIFFR
jgi:hypothetical protein